MVKKIYVKIFLIYNYGHMPILINRYKFNKDKIIGKGGFSIVYEGIDILDFKKIAIKQDKKIKYNKNMIILKTKKFHFLLCHYMILVVKN